MRSARFTAWIALAFAVAMPSGSGAFGAGAFDRVMTRGYVTCGVARDLQGFSSVDENGKWSGFDVEFCSALAAAVLGDKGKVKFLDLASGDRFKALRSGDIDVLLRGTSWTLTRDSELGARFVGIMFYDGQGFLVPRSHSIGSVLELSGASVCVLPGSIGQRAVEDYFNARKMRFQLITSEKWDELVKAYSAGGCTVLTGNLSLLAHERSKLPNSGEHMLLPELISKEPLGPAVAAGDEQWFGIVRWTMMALIGAEEMGITKENVDSMRSSSILDIRRFLGLESNLGQPLGLTQDWAYKIVHEVGNYAEIFERTLGAASPLKLPRGLNSTWTNGGLLYAAPFR